MIYDNNDLFRAMREAFIDGWHGYTTYTGKPSSNQDPDAGRAADAYIESVKQRLINTRNDVPDVSSRVPPSGS